MSKRDAGTIFISLQVATDKLSAGLHTAEAQLKRFSQTATQIGQRLTLAFTLPFGILGKNAIQAFAEFDTAVAESVAFFGDSGKAMRKELAETAMAISTSTKFTAVEAAKGFQSLGQAGYDASQAISALPIVANFATAAQTDLADSTKTLVQIQTALGLTSEDAGKNMEGLTRVADVLARASLDTTNEITDLAAALASQLGGTLRQARVPIEEATAALEVLGAQGIKGAKAGTALSVIIRELGVDFLKHSANFKKLGVDVFDASGQFVNILTVIKRLNLSLSNMSDIQRVAAIESLGFTKRNSQFLLMFMGMSKEIDKFTKKNYQAKGSIEQIAKTINESFGVQLAIVHHRLQNVVTLIGKDLSKAFLVVAKMGASLAESFMKLPDGLRQVIEIGGVLLATIGPIILGVGILGNAFVSMAKLGGLAFTSIIRAASALAGFISTPALVVAGIGLAAVAIYTLWPKIAKLTSDFIAWFQKKFPETATIIEATWIKAKQLSQSFWDWLKEQASITAAMAPSAMTKIGEALGAVWEVAKNIVAIAINNINDLLNQLFNNVKNTFPRLTKFIEDVWNALVDAIITIGRTIGEQLQAPFNWIEEKYKKLLGWAQQVKSSVSSNPNHGASGTWDAPKADDVPEFTTTIKALTGAFDDLGSTILPARKNLKDVLSDIEGGSAGAKKAANAMEELARKLELAGDKGDKMDIKDQLDQALESLDKVRFDSLKVKLANAVSEATIDGLQGTVDRAGGTDAAKKLAEQVGKATADAAVADVQRKWDEESPKIAKRHEEDLKQAYHSAVESYKSMFADALHGFKDSDYSAMLEDFGLSFAASIAASFDKGLADGIKNSKDLVSALGEWLGKSVADAIGSSITSSGGGVGGTSGSSSGGGILGSLGSWSSLFSGNVNGGSSTLTAAQADAAGMQGPAMANGTFATSGQSAGASSSAASWAGPAMAALQVASAAFSAAGADKAHKDNRGTGAAIGSGIGTAIGAIGGPLGMAIGAMLGGAVGNMVGKMFKWGPQNPQTKARHAFANFIEEGFKKLKTVAFFDAKGRLKTMNAQNLNFVEGKGNFNAPGWADRFNALDPKARGVFSGLGDGLKELLGLKDAVGAQLAAMLAENLGGNIDNARLLVQQLGLSMDDLIEKLVQVGMTGEKSWLEIETDIQGVSEAFKPGLAAFADLKGAMQEFVDSGGRGAAALKGVKDIAVEAMEAGAKTLQDLKARLIQEGWSAADAETFMTSLRNRGITTLQQLAEASNRTAGGIVADMNAGSATMAKTWEEMSKQLEDVGDKLRNLPQEIESNVMINIDANISDEAQKAIDSGALAQDSLPTSSSTTTTKSNNRKVSKFALGGIINRPTFFSHSGGLGLAGEAGAEVIMPATRLPNGQMGVRAIASSRKDSPGAVVVNVYAPNATPGMEQKIANSIKQSQREIISQVVNIVENRFTRGGRFGF